MSVTEGEISGGGVRSFCPPGQGRMMKRGLNKPVLKGGSDDWIENVNVAKTRLNWTSWRSHPDLYCVLYVQGRNRPALNPAPTALGKHFHQTQDWALFTTPASACRETDLSTEARS